MNNFKSGGGFKKGGNKFGNKPRFGNNDRGGDRSFGKDRGSNDRPPRNAEMFKATCAECRKTCEVPFRPSSDKPVYCSDCFGRRLAANETRDGSRGERDGRPDQTKPPRDQRSPRHNAAERKNDALLVDMKQRMIKLEEKLNRILEIINPPQTSAQHAAVVAEAVTKKDRTVKRKNVSAVAEKTPAPAPAKKAGKVAAKKVATKIAKKVAKKVAKKATKKAVAKKTVKK